MSWSPEDDVDEFGRTPREQRAATRCQCGYPDWPGSCPGPAACPCCQSDDGDDAALFANEGRHAASDGSLLHTTRALLRQHDACTAGYRKLMAHLGGAAAWPEDRPIPLLTVLESNGAADAIWCLRAVLPDEEAARDRIARLFAADCAAAVLPIFERARPGDARPREAIEAARQFARGNLDAKTLREKRAAAYAAADAAYAAYAAYAAADAAYAAADAAYAAAADAAYAAAAAAADAAYAAAYADAREQQAAILRAYLTGERS